MFARSSGTTMPAIFEKTQVVSFDHSTTNASTPSGITNSSISKDEKYLVYSMYANRPSLSVYDDQQQVATSGAGTKSVIYDSNHNTLRI